MLGNLLVIGGSGQLGKYFELMARDRGYKLTAPSHNELDLADTAALAAVLAQVNPDVVINAAAFHVTQVCEKEPAEAFRINAGAVASLAALLAQSNTPLITYSTDYVFDGEKKTPYAESDVPRPIQVYGASKLAGEYAAKILHPKGAFIIRTSGVYGGHVGSSSKKGNFVLNILKEGVQGNVTVGADTCGSPTYARDLASATLSLMECEAPPSVYHLVNEGMCSWYEFTREIFSRAGLKAEVLPGVAKPVEGMRRPKFSPLVNTRAKALGIVLPSWQEGLVSYLREIGRLAL